MPDVRITLFGALEVAHGASRPQRPPTQRVLSLLGYLIAHRDVPQGRDKLVDLLWPDLEPRQGRRVLSDTLWRARRMLTPPNAEDTPTLVVTGDTVTFRPDASVWVDVAEFERLARDMTNAGRSPSIGVQTQPADIEALAAAVDLYRGDFLEECYDDWAVYERERLRELYLSALQRLLTHYRAMRAHEPALQIALRLVSADPLREEAHRELIRLYYMLGREADALRAFERCRTLLDEELGVEPDPETLSLYEEITAMHRRRLREQSQLIERAVSTTGPALNRLPFIGRQEQRAEVIEAIEHAMGGAGCILLVAAEAGMGKSHLLQEAAHSAQWRSMHVSWGHGREDAQAQPLGPLREALSVALTPLRARQVAELVSPQTLAPLASLLPELAESLPDLPLPALQPLERQVANLHAAINSVVQALGHIAPQLIILEDAHWFDPATLAALAALQPILRNARVLLLLSGRADELPQRQAVWDALLRFDRIGPFSRIDLPGLTEEDCAHLVKRALRLRQPAPHFSSRIFKATGGNPFFILETLRSLQEQGLLTRDAQGIWHTPYDSPGARYDDLPLPQSLRDAIGKRLHELPYSEREALAAAAVLGRNFTPGTWAGMTTDEQRAVGAEQSSTTDNVSIIQNPKSKIQNLVRRHFLIEDDTGYRFGHDTLREVIYAGLDVQTRQNLHLRAAEALEHEQAARVEALAQHLYLAGAWARSAQYLVQAGDQAQKAYALQDALRCYNQALDAAAKAGFETTNLPLVWDIELKRGQVAIPLGDYSTTIAAFTEALRLAERDAASPEAASRHGARRTAQMQALNGLIYVYGQRNDYQQAQAAIEQAMMFASESPRLTDQAEVFYQAGLISYRSGDYGEARRLLIEALHIYNAVGTETDRAKCLSHIGWSLFQQEGPTDQVVDYFHQAMEMYRQQGDQLNEYASREEIAKVYLLRGNLAEVIQIAEQCQAFFRSINAVDYVSSCLYSKGEAQRRSGQLDVALETLRESQSICLRLERSAAAAYVQVQIAKTLRDLGRYDEAMRELQQSLQIQDRRVRASALLTLIDVFRQKRQFDCTDRHIDEALALTKELGSKEYQGVAYRLLAQLQVAFPNHRLSRAYPGVEELFTESIRLLQEANCADELALTLLSYGNYLIDTQRTSEARSTLIQARTLVARCDMAHRLAEAQALLSRLQSLPAPLEPGQRRVMLARQGATRGRSLRPDEVVEIVWTVDDAQQPNGFDHAGNKIISRQERLRRLCAEAAAQGAEPTISDLAEALGVTTRTIHRDIVTLRSSGEVLVTRGFAE
jgi:DNA-binding SARP family transcriptional activator